MQENTYLIVERVFGNFRRYCREPLSLLEIQKARDMAIKSGLKESRLEKKIQTTDDLLRIAIEEDYIEIRYAIKSAESVKNIVESSLAMSQLVHTIYGTGFGDYITEFYQIDQNQANLVGKISERRTPKGAGRNALLPNSLECIRLLRRILLVQLQHESFSRDAIIAALSQIHFSGFINTMLAWSWWVLEWTLQNLEQNKPTYRRLKYMVKNLNGDKAHARKFFKKALDRTIQEYRQSIVTNRKTKQMFEIDMDVIQAKMKNFALDLSIMEIFDSHTDYLKDIVSDNLKDVRDPATHKILQSIFADWDEIREMVETAKDARNMGFHYGRYDGLLSGTLLEKVTNLQKFSAFVFTLLAFVLTKSPKEFDSKYKAAATNWIVVKVPEYTYSQFDLQMDEGILTWSDWNKSEVVEKSAKILSYEIDEQIENILILKHCGSIELGGESRSIIETRPAIDALYIFETDKIEAIVKPILQQDLSIKYEIHRLLVKGSD